MYSLIHNDRFYENFTLDELKNAGIPEELIQQVLNKEKEDNKRNLANLHILKHYPLWKQNNVLMENDETQVVKMKSFIQKVRDWSNLEGSMNEELVSILP